MTPENAFRSHKPTLRTAALATIFLGALVPIAATAQTKRGPTRDLSKGNTLYVVPYAHLDTQWRWAYPQVIREYIANTLQRNFTLIDKYPNYVFNFSGSRRYEMMKEYYPADYERLKKYIQDGRWFPCGSSVDEGDANVPSAESLVRHVLYGNHYFRREFGVASDEFMLPDCFGFPYALPSILAHCGVKGFSTQKLTWGSAVGIPFKVGTWEGPDGKSIVAALDPGSYGADITEDLSQNTSWLARIQDTGKKSGAYVDYHYYGTGDQGGSPRDFAVNWVEKSVAGKGPITVVSSQADEMFRSLTPGQISNLPHYKGELLLTQHSAGSVTSQAYMKRSNRKSELLADAAEKASVAAMWLGATPYPSQRLYSAWDLVLGSQMHDMLPGTSIPKAYEFCWNDFLLAENQFAGVETDAVGAVSNLLNTRGQGQALVVYNPLSIAREDVVEATIIAPAGVGKGVTELPIQGPDGKTVAAQVLGWSGNRAHILFLAKAPSTGFAVYHVPGWPDHRLAGLKPQVSANGNTIENARFKVVVNSNGDVASIFDKQAGREVLKAPSKLEFQYHNPSAFPAWNMDWDDAKLPPRGVVHGPAKIRVVENGPVRVAIEVERETAGSKFIQRIQLSAGRAGDRVEVDNKIDWQTKEVALKASFPLANGNPEATYDLQLGAIKRGNNNERKYEVPQHQWLDLTNPQGNYGVGILNDSKYGSDKPDDNTVRLTMLYTPGVRSGFEDQATQDFGRHDILYAIAPHSGDWQAADVPWTAKRLNQPMRAFAVDSHGGSLGKSFSLISTDSKQVEIEALKKAEDSDEIIVRLRELHGAAANHVLVNAGRGIASAREVNGQEQPVGPATVQDGALVASVGAFSLKAYAIKLNPSPVKAAVTVSTPISLEYNADVASTDANPKDGAFNRAGETIAAEQLPSQMTVSGIPFRLGLTRDGQKNAVTAQGQKIALPAGSSRVYLLAAADSDIPATFTVGSEKEHATIHDWSGFVGQWDNRYWSANPGPNYTNYGDMIGLKPGYVKDGEVAWYSSHRHNPASGNEFYEYSYLFKYGFDIPAGAKSLTLPNDPRIKVFAVSVAKDAHDAATPVCDLYDSLEDHHADTAAVIEPAAGSYKDALKVSVTPPVYWRKGSLHYTTDGTTPTASSPVYKGPFTIADPTTVKVADIDASGHAGPVASAVYEVRDTTAPKLEEVTVIKSLGFVRVRFSEEVNRGTAETLANYDIQGAKVVSAKLESDQQTVDLQCDGPINGTGVAVKNVTDLTRAGNRLLGAAMIMSERAPVVSAKEFATGTTKTIQEPKLPVKAHDSWTLNFFCRIDAQPADRTIIAGFGYSRDGRTGLGRYFTKFGQGINFWVTSRDVPTTVQLDTGKWQMLTATYDGTTMRLFKNGEQIAEKVVQLEDDQARVQVMPLDAWERERRFGGDVRDLTIWDQALPGAAVKLLWTSGSK